MFQIHIQRHNLSVPDSYPTCVSPLCDHFKYYMGHCYGPWFGYKKLEPENTQRRVNLTF
jgi:hypothetical protein